MNYLRQHARWILGWTLLLSAGWFAAFLTGSGPLYVVWFALMVPVGFGLYAVALWLWMITGALIPGQMEWIPNWLWVFVPVLVGIVAQACFLEVVRGALLEPWWERRRAAPTAEATATADQP